MAAGLGVNAVGMENDMIGSPGREFEPAPEAPAIEPPGAAGGIAGPLGVGTDAVAGRPMLDTTEWRMVRDADQQG